MGALIDVEPSLYVRMRLANAARGGSLAFSMSGIQDLKLCRVLAAEQIALRAAGVHQRPPGAGIETVRTEARSEARMPPEIGILHIARLPFVRPRSGVPIRLRRIPYQFARIGLAAKSRAPSECANHAVDPYCRTSAATLSKASNKPERGPLYPFPETIRFENR